MFNINYMARVSSSANDDAQMVWIYNGSVTGSNETVATIAASGYFNPFMVNITKGLGPLGVNDLIIIIGNDASAFYTVTTIVTNVTVSVFAAAGTIGTANIQNLAVTAAKIANNTITATQLANNAVGSAQLTANVLQYVAVPITSAAFLGMYATPIQLVAAAGANTLIVPDQVRLVMTYNSAAYAAGGSAAVQYDSTANGAGVIASTVLANTVFQAAASNIFTFGHGVVAEPFTTTVNKGLFLSNITGAFTTGNSAMVAHVWYKVIPTV